MLKGYAVNQRRLEYLEKTVKLIDIANGWLNKNYKNGKNCLHLLDTYTSGHFYWNCLIVLKKYGISYIDKAIILYILHVIILLLNSLKSIEYPC